MSTHHEESQSIRQRRGRSSDGPKRIDSSQNHRATTGEHGVQLSPRGEDHDDNAQSKTLGMMVDDEAAESLDGVTAVSTAGCFPCSLVGNHLFAVVANVLSSLATFAAGIAFSSNSASMNKRFDGVDKRFDEAKLDRLEMKKILLDIELMLARSERRHGTTSDEEKQRIDGKITAIQAQIETFTKDIALAKEAIASAKNAMGNVANDR